MNAAMLGENGVLDAAGQAQNSWVVDFATNQGKKNVDPNKYIVIKI